MTGQLVGYLDDPYLSEAYLGGTLAGNSGLQFLAIINAENEYGVQSQFIIDDQDAEGVQANFVVLTQGAEGLQFHGTVSTTKPTGLQFHAQITDQGDASGIEFRADKFAIHHFSECDGGGYLEDAYLASPYLLPTNCAHMGIQFLSIINDTNAYGVQALFRIDDHNAYGVQALWRINATDAQGLQFEAVKAYPTGVQFNAILYNTDNLRILCDFASRGFTGTNWAASSTASGDFGVNNLNTDIVEQVWRSNGVTSGLTLTCDTEVPQGIGVDTVALLNHNISTSGSVTLLGSNDPTFSVIGTTIPMVVLNEENMYYIAPEYPLVTYRYWRFQINDPTNPAGYIEVGTILFGSSTIFQGECFVDELDFGYVDFADTVKTAGHTNVANSRAIKKLLGLEFRSLRTNRGNFTNMRRMFREERTVLKCLWIPTPHAVYMDFVARYAVFGKLRQIPRERHNSKGYDTDYASFPIEVDESL